MQMRLLVGPDGTRAPQTDADLRELYAAPRPAWVRANMIATLDGAATGEDGRSGSINNPVDHRVFETLRGLSDVIVVGAGTAEAEGYGPTDRPIVVVSRSGRVPGKLRGAEPGSVLLATCQAAEGVDDMRDLLGADNVLVLGGHRVDLAQLRDRLAERGLHQVLAEGGPHLLRDLCDQGVLDELDMTMVPRLVGGTHPRVTDGPPVDVMLDLKVLLEAEHTLLGRWYVHR
ncbi:dihydrofolate reductase family protein [Nocardioides sp. GCM10027113]|uniref:dihydrofolate reductase family protein n=1 Tax=unclassified Nocardioides TaxID=2615069 RepID=UPI00360FAA9B